MVAPISSSAFLFGEASIEVSLAISVGSAEFAADVVAVGAGGMVGERVLISTFAFLASESCPSSDFLLSGPVTEMFRSLVVVFDERAEIEPEAVTFLVPSALGRLPWDRGWVRRFVGWEVCFEAGQ